MLFVIHLNECSELPGDIILFLLNFTKVLFGQQLNKKE
jgi:hypothetical protein